MLDTRTTPRRPVSRAGTVHVDAVTLLDCIVRDFSEGGVRLEMASTIALPAEFKLQLNGVSRPRLCRVAWRREHIVGASFVREAAK